ncbi:DUF2249 domain-containing protein [Halomicrobium mukohataei]|uniref:DUF2249 domain-containing protein n=1 Tax=Halomicrobium mukohataei TaxID=57705 RepID=A0A847UJ89_9EURY|nr:DUF2249 domain-containing protein [Halomicrobium mukohataei]NLV11674.1 DUF2249 domain-containing protein [Halomicrobium mukohataei]
MATELDLREHPEDEHRRTLFDTLSETETGDTVEIVADRDLDPHLVCYQIEHDREIEWTYADPDEEPRELSVTKRDPLEADLGTIDVRDLKPQRRHEVLLAIFDELGVDEGFVLLNDHDPKPLYHELRSMHGDVVDWEYSSRGDDGWRVEVVKTGESDADDEGVVTRYDVRDIPKEERHPTIHYRYGMIPEGGTMELIAPHEPRPLRGEFQERYGNAFSWEIVENEPGRCRVQITKAAGGDADASGDTNETEADDEAVEVLEELDVRDLPPAQRHEQIFAAYDDLTAGTGFVLVNDHDPKPLYHQFEAETGPAFRWEYRQKEPGEFRVLIGKTKVAGSEPSGRKETVGDASNAPF